MAAQGSISADKKKHALDDFKFVGFVVQCIKNKDGITWYVYNKAFNTCIIVIISLNLFDVGQFNHRTRFAGIRLFILDSYALSINGLYRLT